MSLDKSAYRLMMIIKQYYVQTKKYDLQVKTYADIYTHYRLHSNNSNQNPALPGYVNNWENMMVQSPQKPYYELLWH